MTVPLDTALITAGQIDAVAAALAGLDEAQRRRCATELTAYLKADRQRWWSGDPAAALAVAAVGCAPGAAAAARILGRSSVALSADAAGPAVAAARTRGVTWLPDLAHRLADRRGTGAVRDLWRFIAAIVVAEGAAPPSTDWFVAGWLADLGWTVPPGRPGRTGPADHTGPTAARLRADPFLDPLLPRLFEVDGVGARLLDWSQGPDWTPTVIVALVELADERRIDRAVLIDGCVGRLLRGDRQSSLRGILALLDRLRPGPAEVAARAGDYLRLLADAPGPVATAAQRALRDTVAAEGPGPDGGAGPAGPAALDDLDGLLDASRAVLLRPDKALVRAQLVWLDKLARTQRGRAADIAAVVAVAADHPAADIRDRAAAIADRHGPAPADRHDPDPADRHGPAPDPDSRHGPESDGRHGPGPAVRTAPLIGDDLPPPRPPAPAPRPISGPDELAEEVVALYTNRPFAALPLERVLDGAVRLAGTDPAGLQAALTPVLERHRGAMGRHPWKDPGCLHCAVTAVLTAAATPTDRSARRGRWAAVLAAVRRARNPGAAPPDPQVPPVHRLLQARVAELGAHAGPSVRPGGLLSAPTSANGALDPAALLDRLAALGEHPAWPWDLTQALLRLPPGIDETTATRAEALRTEAGHRVAGWLRTGGLPAARWRVLRTPRRERRAGYDWEFEHLPELRLQVETDAPPPGTDDPAGLLGQPGPPPAVDYTEWFLLWPMTLPSHRGLAAASALPYVAATADQSERGGGAVLPMLADGAGDPGPALPIGIAYALAARHEPDRVAAVDAMLTLAATGALDAAAVGTHLATLTTAGILTLTRAVAPLRDAAAAGARSAVRDLLLAALPALLTAPTPPRGAPDLLTLAAETVTATGPGAAPAPPAGLAAAANRPGNTRLAVEARRLTTALDGHR